MKQIKLCTFLGIVTLHMVVSYILLLVESGQRMIVAHLHKVNVGVMKMVDVSHHVQKSTSSHS